MSHIAFIGIGSNLGDAPGHCREAIARMKAHPHLAIHATSSFYKTQPFGKTDQDWFVNAVVQLATDLPAMDLLHVLLNIEKEMGRERREKWGPRKIDLDLLFYDADVIRQEQLEVPHPGIAQRRFVLDPMMEIAPDFMHPTLHQTIRVLQSKLKDDFEITRLPDSA